ncbi:hypothetical protein SMZ43_003958 [Cronobacter dublinensis]|nr:hypothetical protein [Cronobacter dublinensis]
MVVSGYSMELYCDCQFCEEYRLQPEAASTRIGFDEYGGETFRDCLREAKKGGWRFTNDNLKCYAPGHAMRAED